MRISYSYVVNTKARTTTGRVFSNTFLYFVFNRKNAFKVFCDIFFRPPSPNIVVNNRSYNISSFFLFFFSYSVSIYLDRFVIRLYDLLIIQLLYLARPLLLHVLLNLFKIFSCRVRWHHRFIKFNVSQSLAVFIKPVVNTLHFRFLSVLSSSKIFF